MGEVSRRTERSTAVRSHVVRIGMLLLGAAVLRAGAGAGPRDRVAAQSPVSLPVAGRCSTSPARAEPFLPALGDSGKIYRGTFAPAGDEFWFFRKVSSGPRAEDYRIFVSRRAAAGWSAAERVVLGGEFSDLYPTLSPDGRRLVFASYRRAPGDTAREPNAGLWSAERTAGGWSDPAFLRTVTRLGAYHSQPFVARDGRLFFRRTSPDWDTTTTLAAPPVGNGFGAPEPYAPVERWRGWRDTLSVWGGTPAPDTSFILLEVSARISNADGPRPSDLWVSLREPSGWSVPVPLAGGVNTAAGWENFAVVTPDGCDLVFVRDFSGFYRVSLRAALPPRQTP